MTRGRQITILSLFFFAFFFATSQAKPANSKPQTLDELSLAALRLELELDSLTSESHLANHLPTPLKVRRQWIWQFANATATEAGLIDATRLFFEHTEHANKLENLSLGRDNSKYSIGLSNAVPPSANAGQLYPQVIGQIIGGTGSVIELSNNAIKMVRARSKHLDQKSTIRAVRAMIEELDADLLARQTLAAASSITPESDAEGQILMYIRNSLVREFMRMYLITARDYAYQNTLELMDMYRNTIGAVGNSMSIRAGYVHSKRLNGAGNLLSFLSAVGITIRPYVGLMVSKAAEESALRRLRMIPNTVSSSNLLESRALQTDVEDGIAENRNNLDRLRHTLADAPSAELRVTCVIKEAELVQSQNEFIRDEAKNQKINRLREAIRATIYGPTKMSVGITGVISGYSSNADETRDNRMKAAGNLTYTCGQGLNIAEMLRERVSDDIRLNRERKTGHLPEQLLKERVRELSVLRTSLSRKYGETK